MSFGQPGQAGPEGGYGLPPQGGQPGSGTPAQPYPRPSPQRWQAPGPGGPGDPRDPGGNRSRSLVIAIAAVVVVAALLVGAVFLMGDDEDGGSGGGSGGDGDAGGDADVSYELVLPVTSGDFRIAGSAQELTDLDRDQLAEIGLREPEGTAGTYLAGITAGEAAQLTDLSELGAREVSTMTVYGLWGAVADPGRSLDALLDYGASQSGAATGTSLTLVGEPEPMEPAGLDGAVMKCQYAEAADPATGGISSIPVCAWADGATLGFAGLQRQNAAGNVDVELHVAADHIATLRAASLVETSPRPAD
ncbi:hypothetical protein [Streptomyces sp. B6B3]|uniref:hypothetical protein n=1 Tax=Streptomyces sp. B6B3 TaxID=3153570 RepID=UPI00325CED80